MAKSKSLAGKFNSDEMKIIKKFQETHYQYGDTMTTEDGLDFINEKYGKPKKLTDNQLVRQAVIEFIEAAMGVEIPLSGIKRDPHVGPDVRLTNETVEAIKEYERASKTLRKKKRVGRPRIKKKRGRPKA
tara:strand:+ start:1250 stop:1639 length:390 start_codon:yes stop_codon:yes gene_type:complete